LDSDNVQKNLPVFSKEFLEEHYRLYPAAHQNKIKEIEARMLKADTTIVNPTYCHLRSLKKEHTYALNSVKLHEYFFGNISTEKDSLPSPELLNMMELHFGSIQEWEKQFFALAMCSRGWVLLGFDLDDGVLRNFFSDNHPEGVWSVLPLLVLDVFEHAYCAASPSRSVYIQEFIKCVKWEAVNRRLNVANEVYKKINEIM